MGGLTIENIIHDNVSRRRNELIADMFNKVHFIEKWGRGIELILSKEPKTRFKDIAGIFISTFKRKDLDKDLDKDLELTGNQRAIVSEIRNNRAVTQKQLSRIVGINEKNVRNNINKLKKKGLLTRVGSDYKGYWTLK